jgi:hypothetical protein
MSSGPRALQQRLQVVEVAHLGVHRLLDLRPHQDAAQPADLGIQRERQPGTAFGRLEVVAAVRPDRTGNGLELQPSPRVRRP